MKIKTWGERCEEHPDHNGIVTEDMIRERMQEEIDELREALESLPTKGYRQCAKGQRTTQFCGMLEDAVKAERERIKQVNAPEIEKVNAHIKMLEDAVLAEREACANELDEMAAQDKVSEALRCGLMAANYYTIAATAIRARNHAGK